MAAKRLQEEDGIFYFLREENPGAGAGFTSIPDSVTLQAAAPAPEPEGIIAVLIGQVAVDEDAELAPSTLLGLQQHLQRENQDAFAFHPAGLVGDWDGDGATTFGVTAADEDGDTDASDFLV